MKYCSGGLVVVRVPCSTRPGWDRQVNGVAVGSSVGEGDTVGNFVGNGGGDEGVDVGTGWLDGEQAVMNASSAIHNIA